MRTLILSLSFAVAGLVAAQDRDWDRAHRIVGKAQEDLHRIEHHDAWADTDRGHYDAAGGVLADVRKDLDAGLSGSRKIGGDHFEIHITHVDMVDRHAREVLTEDVRELRRLRDSWRWRDWGSGTTWKSSPGFAERGGWSNRGANSSFQPGPSRAVRPLGLLRAGIDCRG